MLEIGEDILRYGKLLKFVTLSEISGQLVAPKHLVQLLNYVHHVAKNHFYTYVLISSTAALQGHPHS